MLVCGIGINDSETPVSHSFNGKRVICKIYAAWRDMLHRCYSENRLKTSRTYAGCSVESEWLTFSNFKSWMEAQEWEGLYLDKDLLVKGNKVYSSKTCLLVSRNVNNFLTDSKSSRGNLKIGVRYHKVNGVYTAQVSYKGKQRYLGSFNSEDEAYSAYVHVKYEAALELAATQKDLKVSNAIINYFKQELKGGGL